MKTKISMLVLLAFLTISCSNSDNETIFTSQTITPVLIAKQDLSGSEGIPQQNIVIQDNANWNNLKNQIDSLYIASGLGNYYTNNVFTETTIDFNNFQIIAVFDQIYGNGGQSIDITNVVENANNIVVTVQHILPGNVTTVISQPYHIIKIPKSTKPVIFQ
jgi:hypothetical protein